jgi:hypothetical protein
VTAYLPGFKDAIQTVELTYVVEAAANDQRKHNDNEYLPKPEMGQTRKLGTPGYCTNSPNMLNLFNTAVYAEQSSYYSSHCQTATCGCDGDVIEMDTGNPPTIYSFVYNKVAVSLSPGTTNAPQFWKITLP